MSDSVIEVEIDVAAWVARARADPVAWRRRQTIEITLNAIAMTARLNASMFLKGGILMGLAYDSPRQTADIDLTTDMAAENDVGERIREFLDAAFPRAAAALGYDRLTVRIHSLKLMPNGKFDTAEAPALKLKVAYAPRGTRQEAALRSGSSPSVIDLDVSFNEPMRHTRILRLAGGRKLRAYGIVDLVSEKYRAMLQQPSRKRNRRQDVYDLDLLIAGGAVDDAPRPRILDALVEKCRARRIEPSRGALDDPEIKRRAGVGWQSMELELDEVPEFEACYERVAGFYRDLPWDRA